MDKILLYINNSNKGSLRGVEFEARSNLEWFDHVLGCDRFFSMISIGMNATYIDSEIEPPKEIANTFVSYTNRSGRSVPYSPFLDENGKLQLPGSRGLYDQPEWLINADVTLDLPTNTSISLYLYGQSDVLTAVGIGQAESAKYSTLDEYTASYYELGLGIKQRFGERFDVGFRVSNLSDTKRKIIYDPAYTDEERLSYNKGRNFSLSASYSF